MDNEMIERVARAIYDDLGNHAVAFVDAENAAKAAIKAMREPTDKMMVEMESAEPQLECFLEKEKSPSYLVWTAAIDAIIND